MKDNQEQIEEQLDTLKQLILMNTLISKPILTLAEAALYLNVSKSYLYKLTSSKQIPHYCPNGKRIIFNKLELEQWLLSKKIETVADIQEQVTKNYNLNRKKFKK